MLGAVNFQINAARGEGVAGGSFRIAEIRIGRISRDGGHRQNDETSFN